MKKTYTHRMFINCIVDNNLQKLIRLLNSGADPNYEGGWPIRFAARHGSYTLVKTLMEYGADPHLVSETGITTLQFAVYSGRWWTTDNWSFLLSRCNCSQLTNGAAMALLYRNIVALKKILETGRCSIHILTTFTGRTLADMAREYKQQHILYHRVCDLVRAWSIALPMQLSRSGNTQYLAPSVAQLFRRHYYKTELSPPSSNMILVSFPLIQP